MFKLTNFEYQCRICEHGWKDAREKQFAEIPTKFPCPNCKAVGQIVFKQSEIVDDNSSSSPAVIDPTKLAGIVKKPEGFKDVLRKVASKYPQHSINTD